MTVSDAKAQLTELVRRAEAGEDVVLTRHGQPAVRLVPVRPQRSPEERLKLIRAAQATARPTPGPDAARSQDHLYGDDGLPG